MKNEKKEIREAIAAGERALTSLYAAQEKLKSARGWGMFDMFGGGLLTDMIKHSKIKDASKCMEDAKIHMKTFQKELKDANLSLDLCMEIGSFLSFADFFFDGLVADYMVQSKIANAREQVEDAIVMVTNVLNTLKASV
ncbi:MAG: hypothetical protein UHS41_07570 [Lachnospiraceae bacterium]|nr:hypothetical protein [Lachnospiraceae bacterium]